MRKPNPTLTPQELAIMKVVWAKQEATVRDVHDTLNASRPIAYTTVMTMMRILEQKGYLTKTAQDRAHVYTPTRPQQQVLGGMVKDFIDRVFDGAAAPLLLHLAKDNKLTAKQKKLLAQLARDEGED
jgi:predicted transcriptional regulator